MYNENEKTMYELDLNESLYVTDDVLHTLYITRVPGGWLYLRTGKQPTFVPFNNEFNKKDN